MTKRWAVVRVAAGAAVLTAVVLRVGAGPFRAGIQSLDGRTVVIAAVVTAATTVCSAWRWAVVARGLRVEVPMTTAIAAYYRSQFLNSVLPGGVLGDVHRGVEHGRDAGAVGLGLRAVAWERTAGQLVQLGLTLVMLAVLPSPARSALPIVLGVAAGALAVLVLLARTRPSTSTSRLLSVVRTAGSDLRVAVLSRAIWPRVALASIAVVGGHTAVFVLAARAVGSTASVEQLLPIAALVLLASAIPVNVGGWGPREGAAGWVFAAAGFGADQGVAVATAYGVLTLIATSPGVLAALALRRRSAAESLVDVARPTNRLQGASHG